MKKFTLSLLGLFLFVFVQAQDGANCSTAKTATLGVNTKDIANYYDWFKYTVTGANRRITVYNTGFTTESSYVYVYSHCDSTYKYYGYQGHVTFKANAGETYYIQWSSSASFQWQLNDEPFMEIAGKTYSNPIKAYEGQNTILADRNSNNAWYEYTFVETGSVNITSCNYSNYYGSIYVYKGLPNENYLADEKRMVTDPNILSIGGQNCNGYWDGSYVKVNGAKGDKILIMFESYMYYNSASKWDLVFSPNKLPLGIDSKNPIPIALGTKTYTMQASKNGSVISYFSYTPTEDGNYKIMLNSNVYEWGAWDANRFEGDMKNNQGFVFIGKTGVTYTFGIWADFYSYKVPFDIIINASKTLETPNNPCLNSIPVTAGTVYSTNLVSNPSALYSYKVPEEGTMVLTALNSSPTQTANLYYGCALKNRFTQLYAYNEYDNYFSNERVEADSTIYFNWNFENPKFDWKLKFYKSTDLLELSSSIQTGPAVIDYTNHTVQLEIGYLESLSNVDIDFSLSSGSYAMSDGYYIYSGDWFDFSSLATQTFTVYSTSGKTQNWSVTVSKAKSLYAGTTITSLRIKGQTANPVITGSTITANVEWQYYDYNLIFGLSKGASADRSYLYFDYDTSTFYSGNVTITAETGDFQVYTLIISRTLPNGASCNKPIIANTGPNSNPAWKPYYVFAYTAKASKAIKISNLNESTGIYINDACDRYGYNSDYIEDGAPYFWKTVAGTTYYFYFTYQINSFSLDEVPLPSDKNIVIAKSYDYTDESETIIDSINQVVYVKVPYEADLTSLELELEFSIGAKAYFNNAEITSYYFTNDYSAGPATINVEAMDGSSVNWRIIVEKQSQTTLNAFYSFNVREQIAPTIIDLQNKKITITVGPTADVKILIPYFSVSYSSYVYLNGESQYSGTSIRDFSKPLVYDVEYYYDTTNAQKWTVIVKKATDADADILTFNVHGQSGKNVINPTALSVNTNILSFANKSALITFFSLSPGATAKIDNVGVADGNTINFSSSPVNMVVTSKSGVVKTWKIYVAQVQQADCRADFIANANGNIVSFVNTSSGRPSKFNWSFGDGTTSTNRDVVKTFSKTGDYNVCLTISDSATGCMNQVCKKLSFTYTDELTADFSYVVDNATNKVTFTNLSSTSAVSYIWYFDDGAINTTKNTSHSFRYSGIYYVCLDAMDASGNYSEICKEVVVGQQCDVEAYFTFQVEGNNLTFADASDGDYDSWFWDFGDGVTSDDSNPIHTYTEPGYYEVTLAIQKAGTNCFSSWTEAVLVGAVDCKASFASVVDNANKKATFTNTSQGTLSMSYWNFGDGTFSMDPAPVKTYTKNGLYYVSLTVVDMTGSCMDFAIEEVKIGEMECKAGFTYFTNIETMNLFLNSEDKNPMNNHLWVIGDGRVSTVKNPTLQFKYPGYYSVAHATYNFENNCGDYYDETILVGEEGSDCEADFIFQPSGSTVSFFDKSKGDIDKYYWYFDDGKTATTANPKNIYEAGGYYNVCLGVVNKKGISNITCKEVAVALTDKNSCNADFAYVVDSVSKKASFTDRSTGTPTSYEWSFGDNSAVNKTANPSYTYKAKGYYMVSLKIATAAGCKASQYKLVNVGEESKLKVQFASETPAKGKKAGGYPIDFIGAGLGDQARLKWNYGDGTVDSTSTSPTHEYQKPGTYKVCYEVSDPVTGAKDNFCQDVVVEANQINSISSSTLQVYPVPVRNELKVSFDNTMDQVQRIDIMDMAGRKISSIPINNLNDGVQEISWDASKLKGGLYMITFIKQNSKPESVLVTKE